MGDAVMKKIKRFFLWYAILTKRVMKHRVFTAILLLIPLAASAAYLMPAHDGGIVTIAIARLGDDRFSADTVARLTGTESVIKYQLCESEDEAVGAVESGKCDAAWIFREDAEVQAARFAAGRSTDGAVTIIEREDSVVLSLSKEYLFIAMYPYISYGAYRDFLSDFSQEDISEAELKNYYDVRDRQSSLIDYYFVNGVRQRESDVLTAPVRGLLAMIILLAALASCMVACREERAGVFAHLHGQARAFVPLLCHVTAVVPTAAASLVAICFGGLWTDLPKELATMGLYVISVAAFCEILRIICRSEVTLGACIPILMTAMLLLCPVFLHPFGVHDLQQFLPPYYYLYAVLNDAFTGKFALYTLAACATVTAAILIKNRIAD